MRGEAVEPAGSPPTPPDGSGTTLADAQRHRVAPVLVTFGGLFTAMGVMSFLTPDAGLADVRALAVLSGLVVVAAGFGLLLRPPPAHLSFPVVFAACTGLLGIVLVRMAIRPDTLVAAVLAVHVVAVAAVLPSRRWFVAFSLLALGATAAAAWDTLASRGPVDGLWMVPAGVLVAQGVNLLSIQVQRRAHHLAAALERQNRLLAGANRELALRALSHRVLNEATLEGVCIHDGGVVVHANRAFAQLVGLPPGAVLGRPLGELLPIPAGAELQASASGRIVTERPSGPCTIDWAQRPLQDESRHQVMTFRDVTATAQAHADLELALHRLSEAERIAHVGTWEWKPGTGETYWSPEMFRIFGRDATLPPPDFDGYFAYVPEAEREGLARLALDAVAARRPFGARHEIVRADGSRRVLEAIATVVVDASTGDVVVRGTSRDATEAGQADERFRALLESAPDPMVIVDGDGVIVLVNQQTEVVFGYDRAELLGQKVERLVPEELAMAHVRHRADYMRAPFARPMGTGLTLHAVRKDGSRVPVEISLSPLERDGQVFVTAAIRDVSDRQRAAEADRLAFERLLRIEQLTEIDRVKTSLFNTASHELNTPLTPLKMQIYLLRSGHFGPLTPAQERSLGILDRNLERLAKLNRDILDVARLQSGHLNLSLEDEDLAVLVEEAVEAYRPAAASKGTRLAAVVAGRPLVRVDRDRIEQVLYNLVNNAIKFTPEGGAITLRVEVEDDRAVVLVRDTGVGLESEQIARLFEPFSQVHDPDADRRRTGTGLGLYLSRELARRHGGTLDVTSHGAGHGSTFRLVLPVAARADADAIPPLLQEGDAL